MCIIFTQAFEGGEVVFNGIEVGGVRRQEEEGGAGAFNQFSGRGAFVKGDIIHHHDLRRVQARAELGVEPAIEDFGVAGALKQERSGKAVAYPSGNEGSPRTPVAGAQPVYPPPLRRIGVLSGDSGTEPALIYVDKLFAPAPIALSQPEVGFSFPPTPFGVAQRFFSTSLPSAVRRTRYNGGTPQSAERVPFVSDLDTAARAPATLPNRAGGDHEGQAAGRPARPGPSPSDRHSLLRPETGALLRPCSRHLSQNRLPVCVNPTNIASRKPDRVPSPCLLICGLRYIWSSRIHAAA